MPHENRINARIARKNILKRLELLEVVFLPVEECVGTFGENYTEILYLYNLLGNVTCLFHAPVLSNAAIIKGFVLSIMAILSLIGNIGTMYSIHKSRRRRSGHIYTLLYHLSIADLCVTFWCILGDAVWYFTVEWKVGNIECKLFKFLQMVSLYLSTFIMVLIGVDRFIAVKFPLKSMSKEMCFRLIIFCWVLSGILSIPQIAVFNVQSGPFQEEFYQCVTYGAYEYDWQEQLYTCFTLAFTFILPLAVLATTYLLTVCTLHHLQNGNPCEKLKNSTGNEDIMDHSRAFRTLIDPNRRKLIRRAKMKSLRISVAIVAAFVICWTPYYVAMLYTFISRKDGQDSENPDNILFTIIFFFGVSNSLCNPIIYGVFHLWKPRRKELQRRHSSRKTGLTNLSFTNRHRSGTMSNGMSIITTANDKTQSADDNSVFEEKRAAYVGKPYRNLTKTSETISESEENTNM